MCPEPIHPNVNGTDRTCNAGLCYCTDDDGCYPEAVASSCCTVPVVCGPDAMNPVATINHPGNGEPARPANEPIPFVGVATDPQDGALTGSSLVWTSSELSSPIGTGVMFSASLPAGTHVVTLTATDSDSNTGTDTVTLTIE
jgi:chitinase